MPTSYSLTPASTTVNEGVGTITFTVTRTGDLPAETIFASTTTNQGSSNSGDYTGLLNQTITFTAGQTTRTFTVSITNDTSVESNETFGVIIQRNSSDPVTTFLDSSTFTIQDNDTVSTSYSLTPVSTTVDEGVGTITFTVTRSGSLPAETIFASTTTNQGSSNSGDYTGLTNQSITFTAGQTTRTFTVSITNDTSVESNETFGVIIQRNSSDPITTFLDSSTFTIQDNDTVSTSYSLTPVSTTVDEGVGTITFTVTRSGSLPAETIFASTTTNQGSSNSGDYTGITNQSLSFGSGQTTTTFTVSVTNDTSVESNETFGVIIQRNSSDPITTFLDSSTFTIQDNDTVSTSYSLTPVSTTVDEGVGTVTFTVTRSGSLPAETIFASTTTNQGSSNSGDYTGLLNQAVTFSSGQATQTFTVSITNDSSVESSETFGVIIQRNSTDPITTFLDSSTFTIQDNDTVSTSYSMTPVSTTVSEGAGTITFTVTRSGSLPAESIFASTTTNQGSSNSGDYVGLLNQTVTFASGQTTQTFTVSITNDATVESNETFGVIIQRNSTDPITTFLDSSTFTIQDNDSISLTSYALTPASPAVSEGVGTVTFTVTRSGSLPAETIFASTTTNQGSSNSGDYTGILNQPITFGSGQTTATITVNVANDATAETNETFGLIVQRNSSDPIGTSLASTTFTIQDNDGGTTYAITPSSVSINEADGTVSFSISRSGPLPAGTVYVSTVQNQGSLNNGDYVGIVNQAVTFAAGQSVSSAPITISIVNDGVSESSETFALIVQQNATDAVSNFLASSTFTIVDNDAGVSPISVSIGADVQVTEGQSAVFTVSLATPASQTITVDFATYFGTASAAGGDYAAVLGQTIVFNPGEQQHTIQIATLNDTIQESTETFEIHLSNPQGVTIGDGSATITILDNDASQPTVTANTSLAFMVLLSAAAYQAVPSSMISQPGFRVLGDADLPTIANLVSADGLFENSNAQAFAGVMGDTLYVSFRGTDENADRDQWLDKNAHYQQFSQFIEALRQYSLAHPEIQHVQVTGHSLGAAMAQHFVTANAWLPDPHAITFANPGFGAPIPSHVNDPRIINIFVDGDIIRQAAYVGQVVGQDVVVHDVAFGLDADSIDLHELSLYAAVVQAIGANGLAGSLSQITVGRDVTIYFDISRNLTTGEWTVIQPSQASIILAQAMDQIFTGTRLDEIVDLTWAASNSVGRGIYSLAPSQIDALVDLIGGVLPGGLTGGPLARMTPGFSSLEIPSTGAYAVGDGIGVDRLVGVGSVIGGGGNDQIFGDDLANVLIGNAGTDTLSGRGGGDLLVGGLGNDALTGGSGVDTSSYSLASTVATWVRNPNGTWTVTAAGEGADTLTGVEVLNFTDRNVVLDNAFRTFTGDGTSDLLWRNANTGAVAVWQMSGAVQTNAYIAGGAPADWAILGTGDFNGDGRDDIIWRNTTTTAVAVWADGSGTAASIITGVPNNWQFQGIGDFNFDGRDDFVWRNANDGAVAVWLMNGNTIASQSIVSAAPAAWSIAGIADFDGDGRDDFLLRNTDGTIARWTTDGVTQTGAAIVGSAPASWQIQGVGDFDGDGRADILFRNTADGGLAMWRMNGNTTLGVQMVGGAPLSWSISNVGDYNGDGRDDILWHNTDGTVALWTMNGFTVQNQAIVGTVPTEWGLI